MSQDDEHYDELDDPQEEEEELVDDEGEEEEEDEDDDDGMPGGIPGAFGLGAFGMGQGGRQGGAAAAPQVSEWTGLKSFPAATQSALLEHLSKLRAQNLSEVTILLLGKSGAGKSSTANSLLGERVAQVSVFQADTTRPMLVGRTAAGFTLNVIDTPGLLDGDYVNQRALNQVAKFIEGRAIHAVLYVDRLDLWRVDKTDRAVFEAMTATLGAGVWEHTMLALTHGQMPPPEGMPYADFTERRLDQLRKAVSEAVGSKCPVPKLEGILVENSGRCSTNEAGEKVLPNGTAWLSNLVGKVVGLTLQAGPWAYSAKAAKVSDPNKKNRLMAIPLLLFQVFVLRPVLIAQMKKDGEPGEAD